MESISKFIEDLIVALGKLTVGTVETAVIRGYVFFLFLKSFSIEEGMGY